MKLFKPYVNLMKSESTGIYTLNAVVSLPKGHALSSLAQGEIEKNGKKLWAVTATVMTNSSTESDIAEFSVPLEQGPTQEIKTTSMVIINLSSLNSRIDNPVEDHSADVDYDDAGADTP